VLHSGGLVGYQLSWRHPCALQKKDLRSWVTIKADELAAPLRFYFLRWQDEDGVVSPEYLGHEVVSGPVSLERISGTDLDGYGITPEQSRWIKDNLRAYQAMAERAMSFDREGARRVYTSIARRRLPKRRQGKPWTDEELALTAEMADLLREAGLSEIEIAVQLRMHRTTLYRARKRAASRTTPRQQKAE
jgi:hypothetical protein